MSNQTYVRLNYLFIEKEALQNGDFVIAAGWNRQLHIVLKRSSRRNVDENLRSDNCKHLLEEKRNFAFIMLAGLKDESNLELGQSL